MAWIEAHQTLQRHPKTVTAARLAGITRQELIGFLLCLWWWAIDYAEDGDLSDYDPADIEEAVEWRGEPGRLWQALRAAKFIDPDPGPPLLHDWEEYTGRLLDKRHQARQRAQESRQRTRSAPADDAQRTNAEGAAYAQRARSNGAACAQRAPLPNPTVPNQNLTQPEPNQTLPPPNPLAPGDNPVDSLGETVVVVGGHIDTLWSLLLDRLGISLQSTRTKLRRQPMALVAAWTAYLESLRDSTKAGKRPPGPGVAVKPIETGNWPAERERWDRAGEDLLADLIYTLTDDDALIALAWAQLYPARPWSTEAKLEAVMYKSGGIEWTINQ